MTWKAVPAVKMSTAARTPVYFSITGGRGDGRGRVQIVPYGGPGIVAALNEIRSGIDGIQRLP